MMFGNEMPPPRRRNNGDNDVRDQLIEMLAREVIDDPMVPEALRVAVSIAVAGKRFEKKFHGFAIGVAEALNSNSAEADISKAKEFLEYIRLMDAGFDSFVEAWKQ